MRLPDLAGYQLETLMGEDPFGWNFLAGRNSSDKRLVRLLKSQATRDQLINNSYKRLASAPQKSGVLEVNKISQRMVGMPAAISTTFPGWQGNQGNWKLSSLEKLASLMDQESKLSVCKQVLSTMAALHEQNIVHGGIRPSNVFLVEENDDESSIKIAGFGEIVAPGIQYLEAADLPFFLAPEQLTENQRPELAKWDVYSVGVVLYQLLSNHLPRLDRLYQQYQSRPDQLAKMALVSKGKLTDNAERIYNLLRQEKDLVWPDKHSTDVEQNIRQIIERCLAFESADRFNNLSEANHALVHSLASLDPANKGSVATKPAAMTKKKATQPTKKTQPVQAAADPLDDIIDTSEEDELTFLEKIPFVRRFKSSPIIDKLAAVGVALALLALGACSILFKTQLGEAITQTKTVESRLEAEKQGFQMALSETEETKDLLKSSLSKVEDTKRALASETDRARDFLRDTQYNSDEFFELILENRDTDVPQFRKARAEALIKGRAYYQRLVDTYGNDDEFIVSAANAHYFLGRTHKELGDFKASSESFEQAKVRYEKIMESGKRPQFLKNMAIAHQELGSLAFKEGEFVSASHTLDKSSAYWQEYQTWMTENAQLDNSKEVNLMCALEVNLNSLMIIECHEATNHTDEALKGAEDVTKQLIELQKNAPDNERVIGGLARGFAIIGRLYEKVNKGDKALESYQQASELFADAIEANAAVDAYHLGLGNSLARVGLMKNDSTKLKHSTTVLAEVISRNPYEPTYIATLTDVYSALAKNMRDGGYITKATEMEEEAIEILKPVISNNKVIPQEAHLAYAKRLIHLAELRMDLKKYSDSSEDLKEAIEVLTEMTKSGAALPACQRHLATARGLAGFASLKAGDKKTAKSYYELAVADWKPYIASNPNDSDAAKNARWVNDQLKALR